MLSFKKVGLADIEKIAEYIKFSRSRFCDISLGNIVFWRDYYGIEICEHKNALILSYSSHEEDSGYAFPLAESDESLRAALLALAESHRESGKPLSFYNLCDREIDFIKSTLADEADSVTVHEADRDWHDYIYDAESMRTLRGKRLAGQRNHINKFNKLYESATFEVINEENKDLALDFFHRYFTDFGKVTEVSDVEWAALREQLQNFGLYRQCGGMLVYRGEAIAVSIGEVVGDTLIIHTEKANIAFDGVYPKIVNSFAKAFATEDVKYINREEDCGEAGLRYSKLSYHPIELLEKKSMTLILKSTKAEPRELDEALI